METIWKLKSILPERNFLCCFKAWSNPHFSQKNNLKGNSTVRTIQKMMLKWFSVADKAIFFSFSENKKDYHFLIKTCSLST